MDEHTKRSSTHRDAMITLHVPHSVLTALWALGLLIALVLVAVAFVAGLALRPVIPTAAPVALTTIILEVTATPVPVVAAMNVPASSTVVASPTALPTDIPTTQPTIELIRPTAALPIAMLPTAVSTATPDTVDFRIDSPSAAEVQPPTINAPVQAAITRPQPQAVPPAGAPDARPADARDSGGSVRPATMAHPAQHTLRGSVRWSAASSPILIQNDLLVSSGASLIIEPGVEVQIGRGVSLVIDGSMVALATPDRPVRFTQIGGSDDQRLRWESIIGRAGSVIDLRNVTITGGGAGGTVLAMQSGRLSLQSVRITNNGGHLRIDDSFVIVRDSEISGNRMPYGSAIDITLSRGGSNSPVSDVVIVNNRILNNALVAGTAPLRITNVSFEYPARIEIEHNLLVGAAGPNLALFTNTQLMGNVRCNTLIGGANGLSLRSDAPPNLSPMLNIRDNAIEAHEPPNNPFYRQFNIGKGATSDLPLTMTNNWWELPSGPYEPAANPEGRGEAVGPNIVFLPWLPERPACAPRF